MPAPIICIGAALVDELYFCYDRPVPSTSNPASLKRYTGGVAGNISQHLALLGIPVKLITVLGKDPDGLWLKDEFKKKGMDTSAIQWTDESTGKYASILDTDGSLFVAACTDPCGKYLQPALLEENSSMLCAAGMIIADTNIPAMSLQWLSSFCYEKSIPLVVETVSVSKAKKLAETDLKGIYMLTPNEDELVSLCNNVHHNTTGALNELLQRGAKKVWLRKGEQGSEISDKEKTLSLHAPSITIKDSTGAGDAALAGWVAAWYMNMNEIDSQKAGHALALEILQTEGAIQKDINKEKLLNAIKKYYPDES